ncbi:ATP-dependent nuclease [Brevundimonas sp.]|jgi:predicted ATPase|uniref:ATP-dependent nuclease n=1 Tax=Brevundimonas sp. TaxID=1871086 RepID=UPI002E10283B|nr:AAA family ATPase [Brevundimonas sp.]
MRIESIEIKNLRAIKHAQIDVGRYCCLVGANGAGKSTVLCALNIFFRENESATTNLSQLDKEDFHKKDVSQPIEITVKFVDLSAEAQEDFAAYFRNGSLIVTARAIFDEGAGHAVVKQYGNRLGMEEFRFYFERESNGAKAPELKAIFAGLREKHSGLKAASSMADMAAALREFETAAPGQCVLIPSEDQFYGVSQAAGRMRKYVQWVYIPAVKDASGEQDEVKNSALGRLLARTVRSKVNFSESLKKLREDAEAAYRDLIGAEQSVLDDISAELQTRLAEWSHPEATAKLEWHQDPKNAVRVEEPLAKLLTGDGEFEGRISRFGHGMQRSYIIALLQGLATLEDDEGAPTLVLGCEEPELYQHPPQARHLAAVLQKLSAGSSQVIVSTHSPLFVDGTTFEDVRLVRKSSVDGASSVHSVSLAAISAQTAAVTGKQAVAPKGVLAKLHQVLQPSLNEMFFTSRLVLVEGLEDLAYINAWMVISGRWDRFRASSCHIVAVNGKSEILQPLIVASNLSIPTFVIFDADGDKLHNDDPIVANSRRIAHEGDNKALLKQLTGTEMEAFPDQSIWGANFAVWPFDLGKSLKEDVGKADWEKFGTTASQLCGGAGGLHKNTVHIGARLQEAHAAGKPPQTLERLCEAILTFCATN